MGAVGTGTASLVVEDVDDMVVCAEERWSDRRRVSGRRERERDGRGWRKKTWKVRYRQARAPSSVVFLLPCLVSQQAGTVLVFCRSLLLWGFPALSLGSRLAQIGEGA